MDKRKGRRTSTAKYLRRKKTGKNATAYYMQLFQLTMNNFKHGTKTRTLRTRIPLLAHKLRVLLCLSNHTNHNINIVQKCQDEQ